MPLKTNNAISTQFQPPYLKDAQPFSSQLKPKSSIYLCQPARFPYNSKIQSSDHFSKNIPRQGTPLKLPFNLQSIFPIQTFGTSRPLPCQRLSHLKQSPKPKPIRIHKTSL